MIGRYNKGGVRFLRSFYETAEAEVYREQQEDLLQTLTDPSRRERRERGTTEE